MVDLEAMILERRDRCLGSVRIGSRSEHGEDCPMSSEPLIILSTGDCQTKNPKSYSP